MPNLLRPVLLAASLLAGTLSMTQALAAEDPHAWTEEIEGERALAWARAENARSLPRLKDDPRFAGLYEQARAIATAPDRIPGVVFAGGERLRDFWQDATHVRGLWRETDLAGYRAGAPAWRTILDVDALLDLQAGPGGGVDGHDVRLAGPPGRGEGRGAAGLGRLQVGGDQAKGRDFRARKGTEAVQGLDPVEPLQPRLGGPGLGEGGGQGLDQAPGGLEGGADRLIREQAVRGEDLGGTEGCEGRGQRRLARRPDLHLAGGQLDAGDGCGPRPHRHGRQPVGAPGVEEAVLGQGAGGDHPDDVAADDGLGAPPLRLRRVLHLLADRHLEAGADQLGQIGFGGVDRHAAHGDGLAGVLAAGGQGDAEGRRRLAGVLEEEFIEVAHAEEDEGVGLSRLGLEELGHDRRGAGRIDLRLDGSVHFRG